MTKQKFKIFDRIRAVDASIPTSTKDSQNMHRFETLEASAASNPRMAHLCRQVMGEARSLGVMIDPTKPIDIYQLSRDIKAAAAANGNPVRPELIWRLKTNLATVGVI